MELLISVYNTKLAGNNELVNLPRLIDFRVIKRKKNFECQRRKKSIVEFLSTSAYLKRHRFLKLLRIFKICLGLFSYLEKKEENNVEHYMYAFNVHLRS